MKINSTQIVVVLAIIILTAILYILPKRVLAPKQDMANRDKPAQTDDAASPENTRTVAMILKESIQNLSTKEQSDLAGWEEKTKDTDAKVAAAAGVSLLATYRELNNRLGIAYWMEQSLSSYTNAQIGLEYYEAYRQSQVEENKAVIARKAAGFLKDALEKKEGDEKAIKCALGDCYVNTAANPMQGITLIKEVYKADSTYEQALFLLATFAVRSGQVDKAQGYFQRLVKLYPEKTKYSLYLAQLFSEGGDRSKALQTLEDAKKYARRKSAIDSLNYNINQLK